MKLSAFKIRAVAPNSKNHQTQGLNEIKLNESQKNDPKIEELVLGVRKMIEDSIKESKINEFEARDRHVFVENKKKSEGKLNSDELEAWIGKVCRDVMSSAYYYYLTEQMDYDQTKVYCCQGILKNISQFVSKNKEEITPQFYTLVDNILKFKVLPYLELKYPPSISNSVSKRLNKIFKEINNMEVVTNDFFYNSDITFEYRENGIYSDLIMQVINQIIKITEENASLDKEVDIKTNFEDFEEFMSELFEKVYDQEWMINGKSKNIQKVNDKTTEKEEQERQRYKEQVKEYTHYSIGRKIPENVQQFDQRQIKSGFLSIKSPTLLRIITKWCEQLWEKFENENYYIDRNEGLTMLKGKQVNVVYPWLKSVLKQKMAKQKENIEQYMKNIELNNYEQQSQIMKSEQIINEASFIDLHERICGKFSLKVVNNLQNYIVVYLNRLIHGLMTVSKQAYHLKLMGKPSWPYPPNLLSFKIGDLLRCKCSSKQRQILRIFEQMQQISENNPEKLKIIRIKNRLKLGTNDILINIRYNNSLTAQIQLHAQSKNIQSQTSLCNYNFSHLIYEIKRSYFGPISQMCSIWVNLDSRISLFRKLIVEQNKRNQKDTLRDSYCLQNSKDHTLFVADNNPFICSQCGKAFSNNNYVVPHYKCTKCKYWKCALCTIKQKQDSDLIDLLIEDQQLRANCMPFRCKSLPTYSVGSLIEGKKEILQFKVVQAFEKKYLFKIINNQRQQLFRQLSTVKSIKKFLDDFIIFELKQKTINKLPKIDNKILVKEQIIPAYVKKCYKDQKQTLSLISLRQFDSTSQDLAKILEGKKQHKKRLKFIQISTCNIEEIDFLSYDFMNLEFLNLNINRISSLKHLAGFTKLQTLFATENSLTSFPAEMCNLKLKYLSLNNNKIAQLPVQFCNIKSLQIFKINYNGLTALPNNFGELENLKELYALNNKITNIESVTCPKLQWIEFDGNQLTVLPKQIELLANLTHLSIKVNKIKTIQAEFATLKKLKKLMISNSQLAVIPINLTKCPQLSKLNVANQNFKILDFGGECFPALNEIDLQNDRIVEIKGVQCLKNVQILKLNNNSLSMLPEDIYKLSGLKSLQINKNALNQLPLRIGELSKLKELQIKFNKLTAFPESFFKLKLQNLNFSNNCFSILQTELMSMKSLKILEFESNQIKILPNAIGSLQNLQLLNFSLNKIEQLPNQMTTLKKLKKVFFKGFPMTNLHPILLNYCTDFNTLKLKTLPQIIPRLETVNELSLSNNQIEIIPNSIAQIFNLKILYLNNNKLTQICDGIFDLPLLNILSMINNNISIVPNKFHKLTQLKQLFLNNNQIQSIPDSLETHLQNGLIFQFQMNPITFISQKVIRSKKSQLHFSKLKLNKLPDKLTHAQKITSVDISVNELEEYPSCLNQCSNLVNLKLQNNRIANILNATFNFPELQELNLNSNKIEQFPQFTNLLRLTRLDIKDNPLKKLPQSFKQIHLQNLSIDLSCFEDLSKTKSLQWIHTNQVQLSYNNIQALPQCFGEIGYLKQFSIQGQRLKTLPISFSNLTRLTKLYIQCTSFEYLPENIGNLQKLQLIQIKNCMLSKLPLSFYKLLNLKFLSIFETKLQQLSEQFGDLSSLQQISVRSNCLTKLPNSISKLRNLQIISFRVNKITEFPVGIEKCQQLKRIYAQNNLFKVIPKELQQLKSITIGELYLSDNPLQKIQCVDYVIEKGDPKTKELAKKFVNVEKKSQSS